MKSDELELLLKLYEASLNAYCEPKQMIFPCDIIKQINMNTKRAFFILNKWVDNNWLEYGTSVFYGWLTSNGINEAIKLFKLNEEDSNENNN
jgi:hypothetical protein